MHARPVGGVGEGAGAGEAAVEHGHGAYLDDEPGLVAPGVGGNVGGPGQGITHLGDHFVHRDHDVRGAMRAGAVTAGNRASSSRADSRALSSRFFMIAS